MHEHLDEFKLLNMNARLYDPAIGQFLSPDPYIADYGNSLDYNRYMYARNNPLVYTDPDGEWIHLVIGAVIGGVVNVAMNWKKIDNFGQGLAYFGVGAAAGALGAGVGAGISSAMAGGSFAAGFAGTSSAMTATTSFVSGAAIGGGAGASSGFTTGFGNGLLQGQSFGQALGQGGMYGLYGGLSGAALGGLGGGISALRDGRRFWDGATVTKDFYADVNVIAVRQDGLNDCLPASGESVNRSLGGDIKKGQFREWAGGGSDPLYDWGNDGFWNTTYAPRTGHTVQGYSQIDGSKHIVPTLKGGGRVALTIPGSGGIDHSVVVKSVYTQTINKVSGQSTQTIMYRVMDPGTGGFRNIPLSKIINVFTIRR
jgi:RHS repeat-associated protein